MLGEIVLIRPQARADQLMEAELFHLRARLFRRPSLHRYAIRRDHHPRSVVAIATMHEKFFAFVFLEHREELRHMLIFRKHAMPWDRDLLLSRFVGVFVF